MTPCIELNNFIKHYQEFQTAIFKKYLRERHKRSENPVLKCSNYCSFILFMIFFGTFLTVRLVHAGENREGLLITVGGGVARSEINLKSVEGIDDTYSSMGFAFSARLGWCLTPNFLLYWDMRESAYFGYKPKNNDIYHAGLWSAIGLSLYLNKSPNTFYLTGALGLGDLETGEFNSDAIVGTGFSYLAGLGYLIKNKVGIELSTLNTKVTKKDFEANSLRLTIYWQFL